MTENRLYVYVDDVDGTYRRGLAAGATSIGEPADVPWGDRRAIIGDEFGNVYQIAHCRPIACGMRPTHHEVRDS